MSLEQTPRKPRRNRRPGEDAAKRDRAVKALELRIAGATYRQIGAQLGVSEFTAFHDIGQELGPLDDEAKEKVEQLRALEGRRLDMLTAALMPCVQAGEPRAVVAMVRVMERRARLFGLDAPQRIAGPTGEPMAVTILHQQLES
jgi:DNA-binding CsgD family transcriptional regulator